MSSTRIEQLTEEQEEKVSTTRERWRCVGLDTTPLERKKTTRAISKLYEAVGYNQPAIVFVRSPSDLTAAPVLLCQLGGQLKDLLRDRLWSQLWHQLDAQLGCQLRGPLWDKFGDQLGGQLWAQLGDQLGGQLRGQLRDQLGAQLGAQFRGQLRDQLWGQLESYWVAYFSFAHRVIGCAGLDKIEVWEEVCRECGWFSAYQEICFVSEKPESVSFDENRLLHADGVQAVRYADGFGVYSWHGMRWRGEAIEKYGAVRSSEWRSDWLLSEKNAEYRRALIQGIGYEKIAKELEAEKRDAWREYELLKIQKELDVEPIQLLSMTCPSTRHRHVIRVPPDMQSAREAATWINHGIDPEEFVWEA